MDYQLSRRVTHTYRDGWSYLDRWEDVGVAKMLSIYREMPTDEHGVGVAKMLSIYCWRPGSVLRLEVRRHKSATDKDVERALRETFSGSTCQHEYDGCGCVRDWVSSATKIDREADHWLVVVARSANY